MTERRAVTVRCSSCGLEVTGVRQPDGTVRPSDRSRPPAGAPAVPGLCVPCSEGRAVGRL